jgi:hypothetical protein
MHGTWTLGAVLGGALVTVGLRLGLDVRSLLLAFAAALVVAALLVTRDLPSTAIPPRRPDDVPAEGPRSGLLVGLGVIGAAAFLTEGAATDWAGIHATRVLGAGPAVGSLIYTAFFVAMTAVRFVGDPVRGRLGPLRTIRYAGAVATVGYGLVLAAGVIGTARVGTALAGWVLAGAGMAVVWPVVVSALGSSGASGRRLSTVTTISYGGGLVGPAVIGTVVAQAGLPVGLLIPAVLAVVVAGAAPVVLGRYLGAGGGGSRGGGSEAGRCDETGRPPAWVRARSM